MPVTIDRIQEEIKTIKDDLVKIWEEIEKNEELAELLRDFQQDIGKASV